MTDVKKPVPRVATNLFTISEETSKLEEVNTNIFHSVVHKLLYIRKHSKPGIEPAISYICPRDTINVDRCFIYSPHQYEE